MTSCRASGPRGLPFLGSALHFRTEPIRYLREQWRMHGDIVRFTVLGNTAHLIVAPDDLRHVLVKNHANYRKGLVYDAQKLLIGNGLITSEGELWQQQHDSFQPEFTAKSIERYAEPMVQATLNMIKRWDAICKTAEPIDIEHEMARLTGNIIVRLLFNRDLEDDTTLLDQAFRTCIDFIDRRSANLVAPPMSWPTPANQQFKRFKAVIHDYVGARVAEHLAGPSQPDLLSKLIDSGAAEAMGPDQLRDELVTLFVAGYQTTMHTLTWTWYLLDQHPEIARAMLREQDDILGEREPEVPDLERLDLTRRIILEALRLFPPVKAIARQANEDDEIGGYHIPKNSVVIVSPYLTQQHPDYWPDPERFDPNRFTLEPTKARRRLAYIPFSAGPRVCLGDRFAIMESIIALSIVSRQFRLKLQRSSPVDPSMGVKTWPVGGMPMTLHRRQHP